MKKQVRIKSEKEMVVITLTNASVDMHNFFVSMKMACADPSVQFFYSYLMPLSPPHVILLCCVSCYAKVGMIYCQSHLKMWLLIYQYHQVGENLPDHPPCQPQLPHCRRTTFFLR